jgi:hypothetical protein
MYVNCSSGTIANRNGKSLVKHLETSLNSHGYQKVNAGKRDVGFLLTQKWEKSYALEVNVGKSPYGTMRKCDCVILDSQIFQNGLVIECKWQQEKGSVDEKLPYLVLSIEISKYPSIILIDGDGWKMGAITWLKKETKKRSFLRGVYCLSEFVALVNEGFLEYGFGLFDKKSLEGQSKNFSI